MNVCRLMDSGLNITTREGAKRKDLKRDKVKAMDMYLWSFSIITLYLVIKFSLSLSVGVAPPTNTHPSF